MNPTTAALAVRQRLASLRAPRNAAIRKPLRHVGRVLALAVVASTLVGFDHPSTSCGDGLEPLALSAPLTVGAVDGELVLCTHGSDVHLLPDGIDSTDGQASGEGSSQVASGGAVPTAPAQCYGDGRDGTRVQAIYAHEQGTSNRATTLDADLRRWVGQTEWTVTASAARTGGRRHVRWITEAGGSTCRVAIEALTLPAGSLDSLSTLVGALVDRGYQRADRKYVVFADVDHGACGSAIVPTDDRRGDDNRANTTVGYARVDRDCWSVGDAGFYAVAAHELVHTLGGVQASAPHATKGRHCTDEWDVMCYVDAAGVSTTTVCVDNRSDTSRDDDTNNRLLDCNHDDYFHTAPPRGSYLAQHWNVADSAFLQATAGNGAGFSTNPAVAEDPQGRPRLWSGDLGGAHRPLLVDAYGWEACDLPIRVTVQEPPQEDGGGSLLGGVVGGTGDTNGWTSGGDALRSAVRGATATVNGAVGRTVVQLDAAAWSGGEPPEGTLVVRWGDTAGSTHVAVTTRAARIRAATVTVDASLAAAAAAQRDLWTLQGVVQALGVGRVGGTGTLMAPYPEPGADQRQAAAALKFLYDQSCNADPRLEDTAPGDPAQRHAGGTRRRVDLATQARTPSAAAVAVAAWLRSERGDGWAARAVVCRDDVHADCLAGTGLIGDAGPILYVPGGPDGRLPAEVRDELRASVRPGGTVTVLGGAGAVSDDVLDALRKALSGRQVRRIAGADRFATAAEVARAVTATTPGDRVLLARADVPADAVAAGAAAAEFGIPVLLTTSHLVPPATLDALSDLGSRNVVITGGSGAVSEEVAATLRGRGQAISRVAGRSRSETAVAIARAPQLWNRVSVHESGSVIGLNGWHDQTWTLALAAAAVGAYLDAPVVFTTRDGLPSEAPALGFPGDTAHQLRSLPVSGRTPTVTTVHVGGNTWSGTELVEAFHGSVLPGFDGNVTLTSR